MQGTSEVGINDPPRSSFTNELLPLLVWPTIRRVAFFAAYERKRCLSVSVIKSVFMLSLRFSLMLLINSCVSFEQCSKKLIREVSSLNWSSNEGVVGQGTAINKVARFTQNFA